MVKTSRKFDIEMKDVVYIVEKTEGNETVYETVETQIPMLFVQKDNLETFGEEMKDNNKGAFTSEPTLNNAKIAVATLNFEALKTTLDTIKELLTYDELLAQMGTRNPFFN